MTPKAGKIRNPARSRAKALDAAGLSYYSDLLVKAALSEDIGVGDITTRAVVPAGMRGTSRILAKEDIVVAGLFIAEKVFKQLDRSIIFKSMLRDGDTVRKGGVIAAVSGRLAPILTGERVALNFLQRLSGIATLTSEFVKRIKGTRARLLDTRKTTPCLRLLERYAVRAGGGYNHRLGLFDSVLIKDNHIKAAGGVKKAVSRVNRMYHEGVPVEVEVTSLKEALEAVRCGADIIMLDNMDVPKIRKALKIIGKKSLVEASGGISLKNIRDVARTGVDFISIGALTHSARSVDISMEVAYESKRRY